MKKILSLLVVALASVSAFAGETVTYALSADDTFTSGQTVNVTDAGATIATITYGAAGGADFKAAKADAHVEGFTAFTEGNGANGSADGGTLYTITPKYDATIDVAVVLNSGKKFYILEDGVALKDYDGITVDEKKYGTFTFEATADKVYKVYCTGSKLGFYGFKMTYEPTYTVAGSSETLFGTTWAPTNTANDMVLDGSIYKWEKADVELTAGTIQFKVAKNHNWDTSYPAENYNLNIPADGTYNVIISFNTSGNAVNAIAFKQVKICGDFDSWGDGFALSRQGDTQKYVGVLDLSTKDANQNIKLVVDGQYLNYGAMTIDAPTGWTEESTDGYNNILLKHPSTDYLTYDLTATWNNGWTLKIEGDEECPATSYTLVGAFYDGEEKASILGSVWDVNNTDNDMVYSSGTTYTKTYSNVDLTAGNFQFKVAKNHKWVHAYPAENYPLNIANAGRYNIVVTFDASTKEVTATATEVPKTITAVELLGSSNDWASALATFTADGVTGYWTANSVNFAANDKFKVRVSYNYGDPMWLCPESIGDFVVNELQLNKELTLVSGGSNNMTVNHAMPLSFSMNPAFTKLTITCDDVYNLVGDESLTGYDWDDTKNEMTINGDGLYEWTANDILVSSTSQPEFKVKKNGTTWYPAGDATTNWKITLTYVGGIEGKYNIKITFNAETDVIGVTPTISAESVTIGAKGWATTITSNALDFSGVTEFKAYTATLAGTNVTLTPVDDVQAGTGLVLKGDAGTYYVPTIASSETAKGNLIGSDGTYVVNDAIKKCYGLTVDGSGNAKFAKINNGQTITDKKKAFLEVEPSTPANEFTVVFDESGSEATGIQTLNAERNTLNGETYNLAGQKVNKSYKGLVISNGKKVIVK